MYESLLYIDPNTVQHLFGGPLAPLLGWLLAALMFLIWPLRWAWRRTSALPRRSRIVLLSAAVLAISTAGIMTVGWLSDEPKGDSALANTQALTTAPNRGVIVLGMDGLDPIIMEEMMAAGQLPNFLKLAALGGYKRLQTSNPAESPVAWSEIATGCGAGEHGIFDFLHREPKTYMPFLSLRKTKDGLLGTKYEKARARDGFWAYTSAAKVPTTVIRWPVAFPAESVNGRFLSGFGVPDLVGGEGRYSYFTSAAVAADDPSPRNVVAVAWNGKEVKTVLQGPAASKDSCAKLEMTLTRAASDAVTVALQGADPVKATLNQWTPLVPVKFKVGFSEVRGLVKFMLSELEPNLKLTTSPIHMDARKQAFAFTCPDCFGGELEEQLGPFHTLGMPEQIHPLSHGRYDYDAFLAECRTVTDERRKMLDLELSRYQGGVLAFVFDTSDRIQHAFWSMRDTKHPAYDPEMAAKHADVIPAMYREMDEILGSMLARLNKQTLLLVLSDHGFNSFRQALHVNRWLVDNGYMVLNDNNKEGRELFRDVDWSRTRAYGMGFTSIYLNLKGREGKGIVEPGEERKLCEELSAKLLQWKNAAGEPVLHRVYTASEIYSGKSAAGASDLVLGAKPGYRASWQTALGGAPLGLIEENRKRWSGDHLIDPSFVPGVLFSNSPIAKPDPSLKDIAPTVLQQLGIQVPFHMTGKPLF